MRLLTPSGGDLWLAYGMNVHPGGSVETLEHAIARTLVPLRDRLGLEGTMGIAIRLDAEGVRSLLSDDRQLSALHQIVARHDLVPFTANGFVHGDRKSVV